MVPPPYGVLTRLGCERIARPMREAARHVRTQDPPGSSPVPPVHQSLPVLPPGNQPGSASPLAMTVPGVPPQAPRGRQHPEATSDRGFHGIRTGDSHPITPPALALLRCGAPSGRRSPLEAAENAIEMLHTAKATFESDFGAGATLLPEQLPRPRAPAGLDEIHHRGADLLAKESHERARRQVWSTAQRGRSRGARTTQGFSPTIRF